MNHKERTTGFTLIETIVAIALIAIVLVAFLGAFLQGFTGVTTAGKKSLSVYTSSKELESYLATGTLSAYTSTPVATTIIIQLPKPLSSVMTVTGKIITASKSENGMTSEVRTFIP